MTDDFRRAQQLRRLLKSRRQEKRTAKEMGGHRQPASGALPCAFLKEDVSAKHFLISNKTTDKESYTIKRAELIALEQHALGMAKCPLLQTDLQGERWVTMRWDDFRQMMIDAGMA